MRKVAGEHPFCVLIYMNSYTFHICFISFILLSYLIFDFVCLTLSSADTHGIAKYACTYIRDMHTHAHTRTHTQKKQKVERSEKKSIQNQKKRGGIRKERKKKKRKDEKKGGEKKEENERKRGGEKKRKQRKREGNGFRGVEERGY